MATLYKQDGTVEIVHNLTLENMQRLVGGYIQIVPSASGKSLFVCDEEGKLKGKDVNVRATYIGKIFGAIRKDDLFVGDVIQAGRDEID